MHCPARGGRNPGFALVVALAGLILLASVRPARGQGMMGLLPEPITTSDLVKYSRILSLSEAQWQAVEALHDEYKRDFRTLRDDTLREMTEQMSKAGFRETLESVEQMLDRRDELSNEVAARDRMLFDRMLDLLSEAQLDRMQRVRMQRQRRLYRDPLMSMIVGQPVTDLSELAQDLDLTDVERREIDPVLVQYERTLTGRLREINERSRDALSDFMRITFEMQARQEEAAETLRQSDTAGDGVIEADAEDKPAAEPDDADVEALMNRTQAAMAEATGDLREKYGKLREYNRQYLRNLAEVMSEERNRELVIDYYREAYPNLGYMFFQAHKLKPRLRTAETLSAEQKDAVDALVDAYLDRLMPMIEKLARAHDEAGLERSAFGFDQQAWQDFNERSQEIEVQLHASTRALADDLRELIGPETTRRLIEDVDENWVWLLDQQDRDQALLAAEDLGTGSEDAALEEAETSWDYSQFVQPRLSRAELDTFADRLELDEDGRSVLLTLHEDYRTAYRALRSEYDESGLQLQSKLWEFDEESGQLIRTKMDAIDTLETDRRRAHDALELLEDELFSNIELAVLTTDEQRRGLQRIRRARRCALLGSGPQPSFFFSLQDGRGINVSSLLQEQFEPGAMSDELEDILDSYDLELLELLKRRYDLEQQMQSSQMRFRFETLKLRQDGRAAGEEYRNLTRKYIAEPMQRQRDLETAIVELNESVFDKLESELPPGRIEQLRHAYLTRSYPGIYADPLAVLDQTERARELDDLARETRLALDQLALDYRLEYESISRRMVEASHSLNEFNVMAMQEDLDEDENKARITSYFELQQAMEQARFERRELNARVIRKLKSMLGEDRIRRIGGLPDPADVETSPF